MAYKLPESDETAIHDDVDGEIAAVALKAAPVAADVVLIEDSESGDAKKRTTVGAIAELAGDVSAASTIADNAIVAGDGGAKGVKQTGLSVVSSALQLRADDGTGIVVGKAPTGASTGSTLQVLSVTTTQRDQLVPSNGMLVYNTTLSRMERYVGGAWRTLWQGFDYSFSAAATLGLSSTEAVFTAKARFIFRGTNVTGTLTSIKAIARSTTATGRIRIQDITNALTICTGGTIGSGLASFIQDLGTLSNLPTGEAIWEIQMIRDTGTGGNAVFCSALLGRNH